MLPKLTRGALLIPALVGLVVLIALAGCAGSSTPDPAEIARLAEVAVKATLAAQPSPTIAPTSTPVPATSTSEPTATPLPRATLTPVPTPTPTVTMRPPAAPEGWRFLEMVSGEALLAYPSEWKTVTEAEDLVMWLPSEHTLVSVADISDKVTLPKDASTQDQARELKRRFLSGENTKVGTTFPASGELDIPGRPAFVIAYNHGSVDTSSWLGLVTDGQTILHVEADYIGASTLPAGAIETMTQFVDSVRFRPYVVPTAAPLPTVVPSPTADASPSVAKPGNLRAGPSTNYAVVGSVKAGEKLRALGRSADGKWLLVTVNGSDAWLSLQLVGSIDTGGLPVKTSSAPTVTPAPQPTAKPQPKFDPSAFVQLGQEVEGGGWRFKVIEVHKRKAVYFYDNSYIAQGHFLVVIIDAVNTQSGTDYFAANIRPYVADVPGNSYAASSKGSGYAQWQYKGISSTYSDVNPGTMTRIGLAFDIPDNVGDVLLSTKILKWIYLGNFAQMASEDS